MTVWLVNPPKKRAKRAPAKRRARRPVPKGFRSWKEYMASIRPGGSAPKRKTRRKSTGGATVAKKRATTKRRAAPRKRAAKRRTYRRNPPMQRWMRSLTDGAIGAAYVTVGKAAARIIPAQLGISTHGVQGILMQAGVALGIGAVAGHFLAPSAAPYVVAGALQAPIESVLRDLPVIGPALQAYPMPSRLSAYPAGRPLGELPSYSALPDYEHELY